MRAEPELVELSAYLDQELTGTPRQELEEHLRLCETCRRRLESLRQTVSAIRSMPMEVPPRAFSVPPQRQQRSRWVPVGWVGGMAAAALLAIVVGASLQHLPSRGTPAASFAAAPAPRGVNSPGATAMDALKSVAAPVAFPNHASITDPTHPSRGLDLASNAPVYPSKGTLTVRITVGGLTSPAGPKATDIGISLALAVHGATYLLAAPQLVGSSGETAIYEGSYSVARLPGVSGHAGQYALRASWSQGGDRIGLDLPIEIES